MRLPARARIYIGTVTVAGMAACAFAGAHVTYWPTVALLCGLMVTCDSLSSAKVRWVDLSLGLVVAVASFTLVGAAGATLVCASAALAYSSESPALVKRAFNFGQLALAGGTAGLLYEQLGGPVHSFGSNAFPRTVWVVMATVLVESIINVALTAGVVAMVEGLRPTSVLRAVASSSLSYVAYGALGLMLAVLWLSYTPVAAVLLLLPFLSARWALRQYAEQEKAYDATLRALIAAIEVKDGYTRGHSERVSRIATMIAHEAHLPEFRVDAVRYGALLHDVGKTGIPSRILGKHGKLTDEEFDVIKTHPARGLEMLEGIEFLTDSLAGVFHHHERMDGAGYPLGLVGLEIPEIARIIMVADAFDAMTSTRSYRPARSVEKAVAELRRCEGVQFDPAMVAALVGAVARVGWEGDPEPFRPAEAGDSMSEPLLLPQPSARA
ncbi:MAG: hypothetical protein QOG52_2849 [Frankiaceae bacterium]|nr:hypothetical protein [Frankiaceae bacterium]